MEEMKDLRLIEAGFPCHQVGAETQRERGASSALPPLYFLHVWWARRPLTPSRAAILASLLPADTDPAWFLRQLGIQKRVVEINGQPWTLTGKILDKVTVDGSGNESLVFDKVVLRWLEMENLRRLNDLDIINELKTADRALTHDSVLDKWQKESKPIGDPWPEEDDELDVTSMPADPAWFKDLMSMAGQRGIRVPNLYGYDRAYKHAPDMALEPKTILDPTAGGGSIPFEALRLGHNVIANDLNPVASVILQATLNFPARFGNALSDDIKKFGEILLTELDEKLDSLFPRKHIIPDSELTKLKKHLFYNPALVRAYENEDTTTYLYCRQVTCPNCGGDAALLNTCWLSKQAGKQWGVRVVPDGKVKNGTVHFETYQVSKGQGPSGEDPDFATVHRGTGTCIHCSQAIDPDEIKRQARGESPHGKWTDRLYCVVAVRFQPKLDINGQPLRYKSGEKAGEIKTEKIRFFRPPNAQDLEALERAEQRLQENWDRWEAEGMIPTEGIPAGHRRDQRDIIVKYGITKWTDMFMPRQLVGHITLQHELNQLKREIIATCGEDKGRAIVTYLQFAIDKGIDYNSRHTRWEYTRGIVKGTFGRHDFSLKWTYGEMIFSGPNSGAAWGLSQIIDAYKGIALLAANSTEKKDTQQLSIKLGSAAHISTVQDNSVDLICMDPPYYNNVQYAELSDFFYVWQKRTLADLYPKYFKRRLTDKQNEAVANPYRDGGKGKALIEYERLMSEIFAECRRVLVNHGLMTLMFNHKTQEAWETLTRSLIENNWVITASMPVESESQHGTHHMGKAAAVSSIFLACRKRNGVSAEPAYWTGIGGTGVAQRIREAVAEGLEDFKPLNLNPVDEMVASYGRALRVLSQNWPVLDGDEQVSPIRAMNEASRVVAENQIRRLTDGRIKVTELSPETAMALTLYGIFGLSEFAYDEALSLSKSLNIALEGKTGGYNADGRFIGINTQATGPGRRAARSKAEDSGFQAPLVRKGSKLRLARPGERHQQRLENPQTEWDTLQGMLMAFREGDIPVARGYLKDHAQGHEDLYKDLLHVWTAEMPDEKLRKEAQALLFGLKT